MTTNVLIVYYSSTGSTHALAHAVADGARRADAAVRTRRAPELVTDAVIDSNPLWRKHLIDTAHIPAVTHDDIRWAHGVALGTPVRFGNVSMQLKAVIDSCQGMWTRGELADKAYTAFATSHSVHGGEETTLLAIYNSVYHMGGVIVAPGYTDASVLCAGGNPYGTTFDTGVARAPTALTRVAAEHQGARLARYAGMIAAEDHGLVEASASA